MKVQTGYVVLSLNKDSITQFITKAKTSKSFYKAAQGIDDLFIFDTAGNSNLISLRQKFGNGHAATIELKVLDVEDALQKRIINAGADALVQSIATADVDSTISFKSDKEIDDIRRRSKLGLLDGDLSLSSFVRRDVLEDRLQDFLNQVETKQSNANLYITYGVGSNISYWNPPSEYVLIKANIDVNSAKVLTLVLQPLFNKLENLGSLSFQKGAIVNLKGNTLEVRGESKPFGYDLENKNKDKPKKYINYSGREIHPIIRDTIKDYVRKATKENNVIVLLPDLDVILSDYIESVKNDVRGTRIGPLDAAVDQDSEYLSHYLPKILNGLGIGLDEIEPVGAVNMYLPREFSQDAPTNTAESVEQSKKNDYVANITYTVSNTNNANYIEPINAIFEKIAENSQKEYSINKYITYVSNVELVQYWKGFSSTKNLYKEQSAGTLFDDLTGKSDTVVIVGDWATVRNALFCDRKSAKLPVKLEYHDEISLSGEDYKKDVRRFLRYEVTDTSDYMNLYDASFDDFSVLNDIAGEDETIKAFSSAFSNFLKSENNIPIFRYGVKNPNAAKLKYDLNNVFFSALRMRYSRDVSKRFTTRFLGLVLEDYAKIGLLDANNVGPNGLLAYIEGILDSQEGITNEEIEEKLSQIIYGDTGPTGRDKQLLVNLVQAYLKVVTGSPHVPTLKVAAGVPATGEQLFFEYLTQLYRKGIKVSVETMPFFHLNAGHIGSPCILFANTPNTLNQTNKKTNKLSSLFMSGNYMILGFEHVLQPGNCYSNFNLIKNITTSTDTKEGSETFDSKNTETETEA